MRRMASIVIERNLLLRTEARLGECLAQVASIQRAAGERATIEIPGDVRPHPAEKVIRIVVERAHVAGGDVQQMRIKFGRVCDAATEGRPGLNENDPDRTPRALIQ